MNTTLDQRRLVYVLLITVAATTAAGRIYSAQRLYEPRLTRPEDAPKDDQRGPWPRTRPNPMPTFGDNDRSRWVTVRALVDDGTYAVGRRDRELVLVTELSAVAAPDALQAAVAAAAGQRLRIQSDQGYVFEDGWRTIDKVCNPATLEFYSSKPPLLPTLAAGEYWLLKKAFGWSITDNTWEVVCTILLTFNVLPLVLYLALLASLVERFGTTDWGKFFVMAAGCFGTLLTPFVVTFNNHTIGAYAAMLTLWAAARILDFDPGKEKGWRLNGYYLLAGFAAGFTACNELPAAALMAGLFLLLLMCSPWRAGLLFVAAALVPVGAWVGTNYLAVGEIVPAYDKFGGPWYEFEGAYWRYIPGTKVGIDWAGRNGETKPVYFFHLLFGHHGVFALTPVFLLSLWGMGLGVCRFVRRSSRTGTAAAWSHLAALTYAVSLIVVGYYIYKTDNYGGWTNGPRWLMWLAPLWLLTLLPVADSLSASRWGRTIGVVLLAFSVFSASYSLWNPWRHPWIYDLMNARGWLAY